MTKERIDSLKHQFSAIITIALGADREKKAILDGRGTLLQWMFGMATQKNFEAISSQVERLGSREKIITHLLQQQATVGNESLREINTNSEIIAKLYGKQKTLEWTLETFTTTATKQVLNYLELMQGINEAFGHVEESLDQ